MKELEERILSSCKVINNSILKVDSFLNWYIDTNLLSKICKDIANKFKDVDKVITIETSGLPFATGVALELGNKPLIFAKKHKSQVNKDDDFYSTLIHSFTHDDFYTAIINKKFINKGEKILIVDDFLGNGDASIGLYNLCKQAEAEVVGVAIVVEKYEQGGRDRLNKLNCNVYSCAKVLKFENDKPVF